MKHFTDITASRPTQASQSTVMDNTVVKGTMDFTNNALIYVH
jgi:hypothetical protein